jgi:hypothetical protein
MKKTFGLITVLTLLALDSAIIFAQEDQGDDVPYLSEDDIAAVEITLTEDIPADILTESPRELAAEPEQKERENEMPRLNTSHSLYHLLILDRKYCPPNSDISGINTNLILYTFKHGKNGYLIAVYKSPIEGPVFPLFPNRSRILVDLVTARKKTITEYINSSAFRVFVTNRKIVSQMLDRLSD